MSVKRPIVAMLLAIVLFAIYQWDVDHSEKALLESLQQERVLYQDPSSAVSLRFDNENGSVQVERDAPGSEWKVTAPVSAPANQTVIEAYLENLRGAKRQRRVEAADPSEYGLQEAEREVYMTFQTPEGPREFRLMFGIQPGLNNDVYAMIEGEEEIFTVSEWFFRQSAQGLSDLRDRSLITENIAQLGDFSLSNPRETFSVRRRSGGSTADWIVESGDGSSMPADRSMIDRFQGNLMSAQFLTIFDNPTSSTEQLGLNPPMAAIKTPDETLIEIGERIPQKEQFFARSASGRVGIISAASVSDVFRSPLEWGTKKFVWPSQKKWSSIRTASGDIETLLERDDEGEWYLPDHPELGLHPEKLKIFLDALSVFSARQFLEESVSEDKWISYGIVEQSYRVEVTDEDGDTYGFRLGRTDTRDGTTYILRIQDSSVWKIDVRSQKDIYKFRKDLVDNRLFPEVAQKTTRFEIHSEAGTITFQKTPSAWEFFFPAAQPVVIPGNFVLQFLNSMETLEVESEMMTGASIAPQVSFSFYEEGTEEPYLEFGLVNRTQSLAFFQKGEGLYGVGNEQFEKFDELMANLILVGKIKQEEVAKGNQQ